MRALFLAMVMINLGFFFWQYTLNGSRPPLPVSTVAPQDDSVPKLQLLSEAKRTAAKAASPETPVNTDACFIVGPFPDEAQARTVVEDFTAKGVDAAYASRPQQRNRYWLHTPPLPDRAAAEAKLKQLNRKGFHDVAIVVGGDLRNSISLGYYLNQSSADQHLADLKAKSVSAIQDVQTQTVDTHWVRYEAPRGDATAGGVWTALSKARTDIQREEMPCQ